MVYELANPLPEHHSGYSFGDVVHGHIHRTRICNQVGESEAGIYSVSSSTILSLADPNLINPFRGDRLVNRLVSSAMLGKVHG